MTVAKVNTKIVDCILELTQNMQIQAKRELINKLTDSVKEESGQKHDAFYSAFGGWNEEDSVEELISLIRDSRNFYQKRDEF